MHWTTAKDAIDKAVCLELIYDGLMRLVEVHAVGESTAGHAVMRVWQVEGGSNTKSGLGWRLLRLDEVRSVTLTSRSSNAPRAGYKRGDRDMRVVFAEL
ncbi:MAG TPA: hypothetical protein VN723_00970 [Rhizomicrobium sp.]|jgi:hypothetical protein|nr:hypothetical protein [Rhizomicrobium sp.]